MSNVSLVARTALLPLARKGALPQTLNLFVTARCNARCEFCLYREAVENPTAKSKEMAVSEYEMVAEKYGPLHFLSVSGGEPFLRDDLADVCQAFIDNCGVRAVDIPSNFSFGESMAETMAKLARDNPDVFFELQLSVDHLGPEHDRVRKVPGLFERLKRSLQSLRPLTRRFSNFQIKGNALFLDSNHDQLPRVARWFMEEAGCARFNISFPQQLLKPSTPHHKLAASLARYRATVDELMSPGGIVGRSTLLTSGIMAAKKYARKRLAQAVDGVRDTGSYCEAGRSIVVVDQLGEVYPCEPLWQGVGNLRDEDYDMGKVLCGEKYNKFRRARLGRGKCNCTWTCAMNSAAAMSVAQVPGIAMEALRIYCRGRFGASHG